MRCRRLRLIASAILSIWLVSPSSAEACSCTSPPPVSVALQYSDAVFIAEVISVKRTDSLLARTAVRIRGLWAEALGRRDPYVDAWFQSPRFGLAVETQIAKVFKGPWSRSVRLHTAHDENSCGFPFVPSEKYIVFATLEPDPLEKGTTFLTVISCGRTGRLAEAGGVVSELESLVGVERK
jgi:hypothetical protein